MTCLGSAWLLLSFHFSRQRHLTNPVFNQPASDNDSRLHRFPDGKHNLHLKYKEEFNKMVEEFLLE